MQDQKASKTAVLLAQFGTRNVISLIIFCLLLLAVALIWLWPSRSLPTSTWRDANSTLPWRNESVCVEKVKGAWVNSAGDERMALRTACYPVADIELGEAGGSGMLYITFIDERGHQAGDTLSLHYDKGQFLPRREPNMEAEGNKARVFIETGYETLKDFELHQYDEHSPLWRVRLHYRPEGAAEMSPLGFETIPASFES